MGGLPQPFMDDRSKAGDFIEAMKTYIHLNQWVPGFESAMQKINLTLTLMHGERVARWVKSVGAALDKLDPTINNVDTLWTTFQSRLDSMCHLTCKLSSRFCGLGLVVGVPPTSTIHGVSGCPS